MKTAIAALTLLFGSAAAFSPGPITSNAPTVSSSTSESRLMSTMDDVFGVSVETGMKCTPIGARLLEDAQPSGVKWFQNAEIKHGRIAMVATIGFMVQKYGVHFPLYGGPTGSNCFSPTSDEAWFLSKTLGITFSDIAAAAPLDAIKMVPMAGWVQIFFAAGIFESAAYYRQWVEEGRVPGDYGYDPLGFTKKEGGFNDPALASLRLKEIKNGRVAMLAIAAWVANETIPGSLPVWHP